MYIGPWQEYNLSKGRTSRVDEKLRPGIEQALLSTLDPETAKKAMEAMVPYFEKPCAPAQARASQQQYGARGNRKRTIRMLPHIPSALSPSPTVISARERSLQTSSPLSVRSSQSEPIRYSNAPSNATNKKPGLEFTDSVHSDYTELPEIKQAPPYTQPAYNSPAMLNLLRVERQSRARNQIAALTGWKVNRTPSNDTDSTSDQRRKIPKEAEHDAKLEHVNNMKQLYMSGGAGASAGTDTSKGVHLPLIRSAQGPAVSQLTPSNLAEHNKSFTKQTLTGTDGKAHAAAKQVQQKHAPAEGEEVVILTTPRVGDVDLDDAAFNLISKYFQSSDTSSASHPRLDTPDSVILSPSQKRLLYDVRQHTDTQAPMTSLSIPATPFKGIGYDDVSHTEEYMGGMDGLLAWTSQLDLDLV